MTGPEPDWRAHRCGREATHVLEYQSCYVTIAGRGQRARSAAWDADPAAARDGACHHVPHA